MRFVTSLRLVLERFLLWARFRNKRARSVASVRHSMASLGFPVSQFTDEELEAAAGRLMRAYSSAGLSVDEAVTAFRSLNTVQEQP